MNLPLLRIRHGRDPRSPLEVAADLDEEFALHLRAVEAELVAGGAEPAAARAEARARFGDVDRIRSRCLRVALEDRIMLRKAHVALTITLALGMVVLIVAMFGLVRGRAVAQDRAMAEREMAMVERERAAAVTEFLEAMLVAAEPDSTSAPGVPEILDRAATRLDDVSDEEVAERLREVIERARRDAAGSDSGG